MRNPVIIQGGMGIAVSGWKLARAVSLLGELGVISGTALSTILVRRLQDGDLNGDVRRALDHFPLSGASDRLIERYYVEGGKSPGAPYALAPMPTLDPGLGLTELTIAANFVEVYLAKEGHGGIVGINLLEKIQLQTLPSLFGAMLAGVDYVLMGAGVPRSIPGVLDNLAAGLPAELKVDVTGALPGEDYTSRLDPGSIWDGPGPKLQRPRFLAIVSSATLALTLARKSNGRVDGFVVEGKDAGGHNAPPRGPLALDARGQPIYGERDIADLAKIRDLGLPFWLAGAFASPGRLAQALKSGAAGIQVGTAFALCAESGIVPELKDRLVRDGGTAEVFTDPVASPTGFPFKVAGVPGTLSDSSVYASRERICDLGYLRQPYRRDNGTVGYRCPGEPVGEYVRKGGKFAETVGRMCLCNGLAATVGWGQKRPDRKEPALVTTGQDLSEVLNLVRVGAGGYAAADVIAYLRSLMGPCADAAHALCPA